MQSSAAHAVKFAMRRQVGRKEKRSKPDDAESKPLELVFNPPQEQDYCRNVIAIHGLETNDRTWIYKKGEYKNNWLGNEDMLRTAVPGARIYTYNWSGNIFRGSTQEVLEEHEKTFLLHLKGELGLEPKPIIFIASCFGGLVLAATLTRANRKTDDYRGILMSTVGIVFLASPFRGSSAFRFTWVPALVGRFLGERPSRKLTKRLNADDDLLQKLRDEFTDDMRHETILMPMVCFYETKETELLRRVLPGPLAAMVSFIFLCTTRRMIVKRDSACLDTAEKLSLNATHSMMNKFKERECKEYTKVHKHLEIIVEGETETLYKRKDCARKAFDHLPDKAVPKFCGREDELKEILKLMDPEDAANRRLIVIAGLDGIGKSQLAFEVASRVKKKHKDWSFFWVSGNSSDQFKKDYRRIAGDLELGSQPEEMIDLVNKKLRTRPGMWLLIVDDLNPQDRALKEILPGGQRGFVLVTTNNSFTAHSLDAKIITLGQLEETKALELMGQPLGRDLTDDPNAKRLAGLLTLLPLAIKLASNYMAATHTTVIQYLKLWDEGGEGLIDTLSDNLGESHEGAESSQRAIARIWLLSFNRITNEHPNSKKCLMKMAFYSQERIPVHWLQTDTGARPEEVGRLVNVLTAYSFVTKPSDSNYIDIHRLVQLALRRLVGEDERREGAASAIEGLVKNLPFPTTHNKDTWEDGLPHAKEALGGDDEPAFDMSRWYLLYMTGHACFLFGESKEARGFHRRAFHMESIKFAKEQRTGQGPQDGGEYEQGEDGYRDEAGPVTAVRSIGNEHGEQSGGVKEIHPALKCWRKLSMIAARKRRACTLLLQGEYPEAKDEYQAVFDIEEELLSEKHPSTISTLNSLAFAHKCCGEFTKATESYRRVFELRKETLGPEHPSTIDSMDTLAIMHQRGGIHEEAERLHEDARKIKVSVFGDKHLSTVASQSNLAFLRERGEEAIEAEDSDVALDRV